MQQILNYTVCLFEAKEVRHLVLSHKFNFLLLNHILSHYFIGRFVRFGLLMEAIIRYTTINV